MANTAEVSRARDADVMSEREGEEKGASLEISSELEQMQGRQDPIQQGKPEYNEENGGTLHTISNGKPPQQQQEGQDDLLPAYQQNNEVMQQHRTTAKTLNDSVLYNIAIGDDDESRQRILAFAAKRYASAVERNPEDYDALYNWALVLQESADSVDQEMSASLKNQLLEEACRKYEVATRLCPTLHEAFYNWAIAISDRAKSKGRTKEAEDLWKQACTCYDRAVQLNWNNPQALNNWGLALQELSGIVSTKEKHLVIKSAIKKFRKAIRLQFDFHRAIYNLGTVLYGLAEDTQRIGRSQSNINATQPDFYGHSAIYIAAAHAMKPEYPVYRSALRLVHSMLPLPYLKKGYLTVAPDGRSLAPHNDWKRTLCAVDHEALYEIETSDDTSSQPEGNNGKMMPSIRGFTENASSLRIELEDLVGLYPCADLSLPSGKGFCFNASSGERYLIAENWEEVETWIDAIRLAYTVYYRGQRETLAGILVG